jgi:hypothetical protein
MNTIRKSITLVAAAATLCVGLATASQPAMAFDGYQRVHHVHHYRHRRGFGSGAAWGAAGFVGGLMVANAIAAANQPRPYAVATDVRTGESVEAVGTPMGRVVTRRDGKGRVKERLHRHSRSGSSASSRDPRTGITVTSYSNNDGTRTVMRTNAQGQVLSQDVIR